MRDNKQLKFFFAATENISQFVAAKAAKVEYSLMSAYPLIASFIGIQAFGIDYGLSKKDIVNIIEKNSTKTILDSGLFTLMFGAHAGNKDKKFIDEWFSNLVDFIKVSGYKGACVECDCQKVLGVEQAWQYRQTMKQLLPDNKIINVYHNEDGKYGLDKMIEFSEYIAISVPELRFSKKLPYCIPLANYIKNKKPEIDIHLLGCTEKKIVSELGFCTSCDSSSWVSPVRYGYLSGNKISSLSEEKKQSLIKVYNNTLQALNLEAVTVNDNIKSILTLSAMYHKQKYESYVR
jgi:hypothetical protein